MRLFIITILLLCSTVAQSALVTMDFEAEGTGEQGWPEMDWYWNDFHVTGAWAGRWGPQTGEGNQTHSLLMISRDVIFTRTDGATFDVLTFDHSVDNRRFTDGSIPENEIPKYIILEGWKADGGYISQEIYSASTSLLDWVSTGALVGFDNLITFKITEARSDPALDPFENGGVGPGPWATGYDNIQINVVPIPAAVWLFASALAGLGWIRRKQA
jgi:hypothetical protein